MHISSRHITTIRRRIDFLTKSIDDSDKDMAYAKAERSALLAALQYIEDEQSNVHQDRAFRNGQKAMLKFYKKTLTSAVRTGNVGSLQFLLYRTNEWLEQADTKV